MTTQCQSSGLGMASRRIGLVAAAIFAVSLLSQAQGQAPTGIPGVVAPGAMVDLVQENFAFTEGPVGTAEGGVYFTDIRNNRVHYLDPAGKISVARENSNGANGLALTKDGELVMVEGAGKRVTKQGKDGTISTLTEGTPGMPLMAPNDLIVDASGGVYFTDPGPFPPVPGRTAYVYYLPPSAKTPVVIDNQIPLPNGIVLTNDGKRLIVNDTRGTTVWIYDVQPDGKVTNKRSFATLRDIPAGELSGADGMAIDRDDRLYVTSVPGVQVFDPKGQYLTTITVPRRVANAAFAGPGKQTLYITAREGLYRIRMLAKGPDRLGK
jgi:gluconolactonase